jgi:hypothetical protein
MKKLTIVVVLLLCLLQASAVARSDSRRARCPTPTSSPGAGSYSGTQSVTIACPNGSLCAYTTDGTVPACVLTSGGTALTCSNGTAYSGAISIAATATLKAKAYKPLWRPSGMLTDAYTITGGCAGLFCDSFVAANGTDLSTYDAHWVLIAGSPGSIQSNAYQGPASSAPFYYRDNLVGLTADQYYEWTFQATVAGSYCGVQGRGSTTGGPPDGYAASCDSAACYIQKNSGGSTTNLTSGSSATAGDAMIFDISGTGTVTLALKKNGTTILSITDSSSPYNSAGVAQISMFNNGGTRCSNYEVGNGTL